MLVDLHSHSTLSDGTLTIEAMVAMAEQRGYDAYAVTDHAMGGLNNHRDMAAAVRSEIDRLSRHTRVQLFAGVELSDYPPDRIARAASDARDAGAQVIVVHGECVSMKVEPGTNQAAVRSLDVDILAHPGLLSEQDAAEARRHDVYIELSARQGHCLANGHVYQVVRQAGAHVVVDSDAHDAEGLLSAEKVAVVVCGAGASLLFLTRVREQYAPGIIQKVLRRPALV